MLGITKYLFIPKIKSTNVLKKGFGACDWSVQHDNQKLHGWSLSGLNISWSKRIFRLDRDWWTAFKQNHYHDTRSFVFKILKWLGQPRPPIFVSNGMHLATWDFEKPSIWNLYWLRGWSHNLANLEHLQPLIQSLSCRILISININELTIQ